MSSIAQGDVAFVVSWSQTDIDGLSGAPVAALEQGATWSWTGEGVRIDAASMITARASSDGDEAYRRAVAANARALIGRALVSEGARIPFAMPDPGREAFFTVTDGRHRWMGALLDMAELARPLILFIGDLPPTGMPLFVCEGPDEGWTPKTLKPRGEGVVCFTPGTLLATSEGLRPVEALLAGDMVWTKDDGPQEILWVGQRHISGARLFAMPDLRPVRVRANVFDEGRPMSDLLVSPDHRLLVQGPAALALWGEREVLVAARDLIDDHRIVRDRGVKAIDYIHLMLPRHGILLANGIETESFHPGGTDLDAVATEQLDRLYDVMPDLAITPSAYGPLSRRVLGADEARLVARVT